ncbi:MAG TPA: DNA-binding protein [Oribacterium sp.]|nr:DNA-binding protein [Oribacterium sp.]
MDSAEAAEELSCSMQNIDDLVKRGKLHPIKEDNKYRLFLKSEILQRKWK